MGRQKGVAETGEVAKRRRGRKAAREAYKEAILSGTLIEEKPQPLVPELFRDIQEIYWECLKAVEDPRDQRRTIYPLHLILHRIISGFIEGTRHVGILFPAKHYHTEVEKTAKKRKFGSHPTQQAVYTILRTINWSQANAALSPLWDRLGYAPNLVVRRKLRDPKEILEEFDKQEKAKEKSRLAVIKAERIEQEKNQGMSAAKAKRQGIEINSQKKKY